MSKAGGHSLTTLRDRVSVSGSEYRKGGEVIRNFRTTTGRKKGHQARSGASTRRRNPASLREALSRLESAISQEDGEPGGVITCNNL